MRFENIIALIGITLMIVPLMMAYTAPSHDNVILTLDTGYTAQDHSNVILILGEATAADSCTCPGLNTNWEVNMSDACNLTTTCNLGTGNLSFVGTFGYFNCSSELNLTNRDAPPGSTTFYHNNGCIINRL